MSSVFVSFKGLWVLCLMGGLQLDVSSCLNKQAEVVHAVVALNLIERIIQKEI